jgi:hypothetical protein
MVEWTIGEHVDVVVGKHAGNRGVVTKVSNLMLEVLDEESGVEYKSWKTSCRKIPRPNRRRTEAPAAARAPSPAESASTTESEHRLEEKRVLIPMVEHVAQLLVATTEDPHFWLSMVNDRLDELIVDRDDPPGLNTVVFTKNHPIKARLGS